LNFPIIPFLTNLELVRKLVSKGKDLVVLHLADVTTTNRILEREFDEITFSESSNRIVKNMGKKKYIGDKLY
jgi:hypothetical protein